jgi:hypothetical protein
MNLKKLEALYAEAFDTGNKERALAYVELIVDELCHKQCSVLDISGGRA